MHTYIPTTLAEPPRCTVSSTARACWDATLSRTASQPHSVTSLPHRPSALLRSSMQRSLVPVSQQPWSGSHDSLVSLDSFPSCPLTPLSPVWPLDLHSVDAAVDTADLCTLELYSDSGPVSPGTAQRAQAELSSAPSAAVAETDANAAESSPLARDAELVAAAAAQALVSGAQQGEVGAQSPQHETTWRCSLQCGTQYCKTSVNSIRRHFRSCFVKHRLQGRNMADEQLDECVDREQLAGRIDSGLKRWRRRRPISSRSASSSDRPSSRRHPSSVTTSSSSQPQPEPSPFVVAPLFSGLSSAIGSTVSPSSPAVASVSASSPAATPSWDGRRHSEPDLMVGSPPSAAWLARQQYSMLAQFDGLKRRRDEIDGEMRQLLYATMRYGDTALHAPCELRPIVRPLLRLSHLDDCNYELNAVHGASAGVWAQGVAPFEPIYVERALPYTALPAAAAATAAAPPPRGGRPLPQLGSRWPTSSSWSSSPHHTVTAALLTPLD